MCTQTPGVHSVHSAHASRSTCCQKFDFVVPSVQKVHGGTCRLAPLRDGRRDTRQLIRNYAVDSAEALAPRSGAPG
jgi:hypothetical protein